MVYLCVVVYADTPDEDNDKWLMGCLLSNRAEAIFKLFYNSSRGGDAKEDITTAYMQQPFYSCNHQV